MCIRTAVGLCISRRGYAVLEDPTHESANLDLFIGDRKAYICGPAAGRLFAEKLAIYPPSLCIEGLSHFYTRQPLKLQKTIPAAEISC